MEREHPDLSLTRQLSLLTVPRSSFYYNYRMETPENLKYMDLIDKIYTEHPFYGSRRLAIELGKMGEAVNRKRVQRLMRKMGLQGRHPKKFLSLPGQNHKIYPYLLGNLDIVRANQVWCVDITYIKMRRGFVYLVAIMDWYTRFVLSWRVSTTMEPGFCVEALNEALVRYGKPEIFNTDQGAQFTCSEFINVLEKHEVKISMDGKGRFYDNIFIERLWRSVKYEEVYLHAYEDVFECKRRLGIYFDFYNNARPHQSLNYRTPAEAYGAGELVLARAV